MWDSARQAAEKPELAGLETETRALVGQLPGLLTGLVCAGANEPAPAGRDDGLLTAEEVLWLDLSKVQLVVLSACETALGESNAGEGLFSLRYAAHAAGGRAVVASLWSVTDLAGETLMREFYTALSRDQLAPEAALARAMRVASGRWSDPALWSVFEVSRVAGTRTLH